MPTTPNLFQRARSTVSRWMAGAANGPHLRRWQAARVDRLTADWMATEASINQELRSDLNRLRARGRELLQNNDYAAKFAGMVKNNIIGPGGVRLQVRIEDAPGQPDRMANAAIEYAWADWSRACDVTGRQSLRDLCETLVGGMPSDGEFLVRMVRGAEAGNKYGFALQLIDVDRIDTTYNASATATSNAVIMGVEVNTYRRPVALHLFAAHPNDGAGSNRTRVRVAYTDTLHCFKVERAEQMRGVPWMAPGMLSLHHLGNFKLSALLAAEHGANHYGFFTTPDGQTPMGQDDGTGQAVTTTQPGTYDTLPQGVGFTPHESKYPNEVFGPFVKTTLQRIASGWRVAYHSLANDLEGVSYSSIRSGALEERDRWAADQEWFIAVFMEPVYQAWLQAALLMGAITMPNGSPLPAAKLAKFAKHEWQPRRWEWVDPKGDMEAKILAVKAGLMAPQDLAAAMGYDFDDTLTSIAAAQASAKLLGVNLTAYDATPGAQQAVQGDGKGTQAAQAAKAEQAASNTRTLDALGSAIKTLAEREAPAPVVTVNNHLPAAQIDVKAAEPAAVNVINQINPTPVEIKNTVNVEPTPVDVTANFEAVVQPAPVTVNNTHPKRATQTVARDVNDEITGTVTTYES